MPRQEVDVNRKLLEKLPVRKQFVIRNGWSIHEIQDLASTLLLRKIVPSRTFTKIKVDHAISDLLLEALRKFFD